MSSVFTPEWHTISAPTKMIYTQQFNDMTPVDGLVSGKIIATSFIKYGVAQKILKTIWTACDIEKKGSLSLPQYILAMHLLITYKSQMITEIPDPLPSSLITYAHNSMGEVNSMSRAQSQYEPNRGNTTPIRKPQLETTIPEDLRKTYLDTFAQLDPLNLKKVDGEVVSKYLALSRLPQSTLATIWQLCNRQIQGYLTQTEFVVAMWLTKSVTMGYELPIELPEDLFRTAQTSLPQLSPLAQRAPMGYSLSQPQLSQTDIVQQRSMHDMHKKSLQSLREVVAQERSTTSLRELDLEGHDKAIKDTQLAVQAAQSELNSILEARVNLEAETNRLRSERTALNEELEETRSRIVEARSGIQEIETEIAELRSSHTNASEAHRTSVYDLEEARERYLALEAQRDELRSQVKEFAKTSEAAVAEWKSMQEQMDSMRIEIDELEANLAKQKLDYDAAVGQSLAARPDLGLLQLKLEGLKDTQTGRNVEIAKQKSRENLLANEQASKPQEVSLSYGDFGDVWAMPQSTPQPNIDGQQTEIMAPIPEAHSFVDDDIFFSRAGSPNSMKSLPARAPDLLGSFGSSELARPHTQPADGKEVTRSTKSLNSDMNSTHKAGISDDVWPTFDKDSEIKQPQQDFFASQNLTTSEHSNQTKIEDMFGSITFGPSQTQTQPEQQSVDQKSIADIFATPSQAPESRPIGDDMNQLDLLSDQQDAFGMEVSSHQEPIALEAEQGEALADPFGSVAGFADNMPRNNAFDDEFGQMTIDEQIEYTTTEQPTATAELVQTGPAESVEEDIVAIQADLVVQAMPPRSEAGSMHSRHSTMTRESPARSSNKSPLGDFGETKSIDFEAEFEEGTILNDHIEDFPEDLEGPGEFIQTPTATKIFGLDDIKALQSPKSSMSEPHNIAAALSPPHSQYHNNVTWNEADTQVRPGPSASDPWGAFGIAGDDPFGVSLENATNTDSFETNPFGAPSDFPPAIASPPPPPRRKSSSPSSPVVVSRPSSQSPPSRPSTPPPCPPRSRSPTLSGRPSPTTPSAVTKPDITQIETLTNLGFTEEQASMALARYDGNVEAATNYLLDMNI